MIRNLLLLVLLATSLSACKKPGGAGEEKEPEPPAPNTPFKTLNFLYSISGSKTLSGIHNREPNSSPARFTEQMKSVTGKYPALWSGDFLFQQDNINNRQIMINEAVNQWKKGAVINLMWHACNPARSQPCEWDNGQGVMSSLSDAEWNDLLTEGTAINTEWKSMMDEVSGYLKFLKDQGVEVLWRPLHEMNQGKFWWGGRPGANGTRKLWQYTHNYMKNVKGLTNLIWVWDMQDFSTLSADLDNYNPGAAFWDVAALDFYDGSGFSLAKYQAMLRISGGKPIAIGECDKLPTAQQLVEQPKWTFFMGWSELVFEQNSTVQLTSLHSAGRVLTLDKMPGW
ncbi:glycoside hydrolase [Pedobacter yulinensis]|uniref:Glycoside hydrolase n=1 Tax=Pedobacter yulinensis TaxID=2126353 RepID=A0A2T3HK22_9SPHI|nr:glycosyl hydrolase [Pedobacter yulinensis]PST82731.1 glycoside hydrolase [Pedobacter yulinensis]